MKYEPGPNVEIYFVYNFIFYSDLKLGEVQKATTSVSSRNHSRTYLEDLQNDDEDVERILSYKWPSRKAQYKGHNMDTEENSINPSAHHNNTHEIQGCKLAQGSGFRISLQGQLE